MTKPSAQVIMDVNFGPKVPHRVIRIRAGAKILQIASDSIQDAVWEPVEDMHDGPFLDCSVLKIIPYHSECNLAAGASYYVICKQPNKCRYVVLWEDSTYFGVFTLQGGSNSSLQSATGLAVCLAKNCFVVFKKVKRLAMNQDEICHTAPVKIFPQNVEAASQTVHDVLKSNSYDSGPNCNRVCMVALEGFNFEEEGTSVDQLYPSLKESLTNGPFPGDFEDNMTTSTFISTILGRKKVYFDRPSQVTVNDAYNVLKLQEERRWKLIPEQCIPSSLVCLQSLDLDLDGAIMHFSAPSQCKNLVQLVADIKATFSVEMSEKCVTPYVPRGKQWRFCVKAEHKPTIFQKGVYVRLPQPENTTEVVKIWLHMPASTELPAKFLDTIRVVFNSVAKQILESQTMAPTKKSIALSNLASNSSSQSVMIPCGILLSLVSFLHIACIHPNIQLVFETYNGKTKGLSVPVKIGTNGEPDLPQASFDLRESCVRTDSLFSILSKLIRKDILRMKLDSSSFGFGFRAIFTNKTDNKLVLAAVNPKMSTDSRQVQLWPLAYLDAVTCPNLISFNDAKRGRICRCQFYLEFFSMQKPSNSNSKWSYSRTGQDLKAAMNNDSKCSHCKDKTCTALNTSVLRFGLPATCDKLDESFQLFGKTGGSRFEVAVRPTLLQSDSEAPSPSTNDNGLLAFDFSCSVASCWTFLKANVQFFDNSNIVHYGILNTAACLLGYRAALDELSSSSPGSKSQEELFCFVRYTNAILNSICSGQYVDGQNPKLFLSKLGLTTGRPLALIPTIPLSVLERVRCWDPNCPLPTVEAPIHAHSAASLHALQNCIESRIIENTDQTEIMDCMVCWHCKELFYGDFDTRKRLLQSHLEEYNHWKNSKAAVPIVDGKMWRRDFEDKRKALETELTKGSTDQQWTYKLAMSWMNICLVGVPGSGKTWMIKKLGMLMQCIFFRPGELLYCSPLGRVAMNLHPDARTLHRILKIQPLGNGTFPETLGQLTTHLNSLKPRPFSNLKMLIGTEMFMCHSPHLQSVLVSKTRFGVSDGGYCSSSVPVFTQKRGVLDFDWSVFTVMELVACQVTMERKYHWLLYLKGAISILMQLRHP